MPSVFKKAVNAVKDQASISLVSFSKNYVPGSSRKLDVALLKATSHEEKTAREKHITNVILLVLSSTMSAAACVHALARRIARTHDWVVALKSLQLVHHLLRDGGTYFSHEAASLRPTYSDGRRLLDLSNFSASQSGNSNPWDYTAFVRTYARYLDARLESALFGKLRKLNHRGQNASDLISSMKPEVILDHIEHWQRLLDRVMSMKPTGPARDNRLVHITLFMVTRESIDYYRHVSVGLTLLLDKFFQLDQKCRIKTVEACELAGKKFEELDNLYDLCIKIGVGRMIEYPHVQMISHTLVTTLKSYLYSSLASVGSSPASETRSQSRFSLQSLPKEMDEDVASDSYSISSEHTNIQKKKVYEPTRLSLMHFDTLKKKTKQSDSEGWELLLVETASKLSDSDTDSYGQQLLPESINKSLPENYNNPFLQEYNKKSLSREISITEKSAQYSFNKNLSTERSTDERTNAYTQAEQRFMPLAQMLNTTSNLPPLFQQRLRWMNERQKVYRSIGY